MHEYKHGAIGAKSAAIWLQGHKRRTNARRNCRRKPKRHRRNSRQPLELLLLR